MPKSIPGQKFSLNPEHFDRCNEEVFEITKEWCLKDHTLESIFSTFFYKWGFKPVPSMDQMKSIVKRVMDKDSTLNEEFNKNCIDLMSKIIGLYFMFKKSSFYIEDSSIGGVCKWSTRYYTASKVVEGELKALVMYDLFHQQKREFSVIGTDFGLYCRMSSGFYHFLMNRILASRHHGNGEHLYLFGLDSDKQEVKLLDQQSVQLPQLVPSIRFDLRDSNRFAIITVQDRTGSFYVSLNNLSGDKINSDEKVSVYPHLNDMQITFPIMRHSQLIDQKLCFLDKRERLVENGRSVINIAYHEIDLYETTNDTFKFEFKTDSISDIDPDHFWKVHHAWTSDKICYLCVPNETSNLSKMYAFNTNTRQCQPIDLAYQLLKDVVGTGAFFANDKDFLFVRMDLGKSLPTGDGGYVRKRFAYCQYSLRKPESFQHLVWFKIRKLAVYKDEDVYKKAMKLLPLNSELQPFHF